MDILQSINDGILKCSIEWRERPRGIEIPHALWANFSAAVDHKEIVVNSLEKIFWRGILINEVPDGPLCLVYAGGRRFALDCK